MYTRHVIVTQSLVGRVDLVLVMCELGLLGTVRQLHQLGLLPEHDQGLLLLIQEVTIQRRQLNMQSKDREGF